MVTQTGKYRQLIGFKVGKAAEAIPQIQHKSPQESLQRGNPVTLLAMGFDPEARHIGDWREER